MSDMEEPPCPPPSFRSVDVIIPIFQMRKRGLREVQPHSLRVAELRSSPWAFGSKTRVFNVYVYTWQSFLFKDETSPLRCPLPGPPAKPLPCLEALDLDGADLAPGCLARGAQRACPSQAERHGKALCVFVRPTVEACALASLGGSQTP